MTKVQPWAVSVVHDGVMEHWRITALLAKSSHRMWETLTTLPTAERDNLPEEVQKLIPVLYRQLELTDYYLSGLMEGENHVS